MKAILFSISLFTFVAAAHADLVVPNGAFSSREKTVKYTGARAEKKYNSLKDSNPPMTNSSGWSGDTETFRVERSENGLTQTVCQKVANFRDAKQVPVYSCTRTTSEDGKPVAPFQFHHRMG